MKKSDEIKTYLKELGFIEGDWGFLSHTMMGVKFVLLDDFLGYTLSYSFVGKRGAMDGEIQLGRKPTVKEIKNAISGVLIA